MTNDIHLNYINGEWKEGYDTIENINPSDVSDVVGFYAKANSADCEAAIQAASSAFSHWSQSALEQRKTVLDKIGAELIARSSEIGEILAREEGKTLVEGIGEVARSGQFFQYYGAEVLRLMGENTASVRPGVDVEVHREPLGVIGIVTPWNFPMAVASWKVAPAIAYGNCVVLKPAELVPGSAWILADIISRSGLPDGVFNLVMGSGREVGETLCTSSDIQAVTFTGSVEVGRRIARNAIENMARVQLEMGSKNALVVLNDADIDTAVQCAVSGAFFGTGQKCTASSRIIVESGIHDKFVSKMTDAMANLVVGNALTPGAHIGAVVDERQLKQNLDYIEIAKSEGAELVMGGERLSLQTEGFFMSPALFINTNNQMQINREEIFGPIACVIKVDNYEQALEVSNDSDFGLTSGIITESLKYASHFKRNSKSGCVMVNLPTAGTDYHVPFGGRKASSYGPREQGQYARDFYTIIKTNYSKPY